MIKWSYGKLTGYGPINICISTMENIFSKNPHPSGNWPPPPKKLQSLVSREYGYFLKMQIEASCLSYQRWVYKFEMHVGQSIIRMCLSGFNTNHYTSICVMKGRHNENGSPALACISLLLNMNKVLLYSFVFYIPQSSIKDFAWDFSIL